MRSLLFMDLEEMNKNMKRSICFLKTVLCITFFSCNKRKIQVPEQKQEKQNILQKIDSFDIEHYSLKTGELDFQGKTFANDSVFYCNDFFDAIKDKKYFYIKGKKHYTNYSSTATDSIVKMYDLKKEKFGFDKKMYQEHFKYEDCILKREVKLDSGAVHTLLVKNGATFQIIDIKHKPIWLQVCYEGKTYKERIKSGNKSRYAKGVSKYGTFFLGLGHSKVLFYDIDKDGEDELIIIINDIGSNTVYAHIYKINLPK